MNERNTRSWIKHLDFIIIDLICLAFSFWVSFYYINNNIHQIHYQENYSGLFILFLSLYVIIVFLCRSLSNVIRRGYVDEFFCVIKDVVFVVALGAIYLVFTKQSSIFSRLFLGYFGVISVVLMTIFRCIWKRILRTHIIRSDKLSKMLVVTTSSLAHSCVTKLTSRDYQGFGIAGLVLLDETESDKQEMIDGIKVVAVKSDMMEYIRLNVVDSVLFHVDNISEISQSTLNQLIEMGVIVHINMEQFEHLPNKTIGQVGELSVITGSFQTAGKFSLAIKRLMDICGALVGLVITAVAFIFVAPIIKIKSPGPVFFAQNRIGKNGRKFKIYKFRSMYMDAEERKKELMAQNKMQGLMFKMDNDPRIIKGIGNFIRNTSIDELPQFWNILKGDMSLVGTRPPTVDEFEQYDLHHKIRLSFRPGLTGMWQVSGRSDIVDFEEVVRLDEKYIANWSVWLDIKILFKTVAVVLQRKGSE